jgi:hypothetical protein
MTTVAKERSPARFFAATGDRVYGQYTMKQKTDKEIEEDESRTTSMGLFNLAEAYRMSGEALMAAKIKTADAESPVRFLYYHAIELFIKAFLRQHGHSVAVLSDPKRFGHMTTKLTARRLRFRRDRFESAVGGKTSGIDRSSDAARTECGRSGKGWKMLMSAVSAGRGSRPA